MSASCSINLSEFFNDDESGGRRFLDFIKKRKGDIRKQNVLFMDREIERLSLEVQLEKIQTPQPKQAEITSSNKTNCLSCGNLNEKENGEKFPSDSPAARNSEFLKPQDLPSRTASAIQPTDCTNTRPILRECSNRPDIRKSGGFYSPSDKLRRLSIKNCSVKKLPSGKRTLLQEFENTLERTNFNPSMYSTPNSLSTPLPERENIDPNNGKYIITSDSCCSHNELKDSMESILDETLKQIENQLKLVQNSCTDSTIANRTKNCTASKRTFTVEKGSIPGQIVLTPDKSGDQNTQNSQHSPNPNNHQAKPLSPCRYPRHSCKITAQKSARPVLLDCSLTEKIISKIHETEDSKNQTQKDTELQKTQNENFEIPNSSCNNLSIIFPTQDIEIPETQTNIKDNTLRIYSDKEQHVVVIPFNQTISEVSNQGRKSDNRKSECPKINSCSSSVQNQNFKQIEVNLTVAGILTDDEDMTPNSILQNVSETPLNLAPSAYNLRKKRLQKRSSQLHNNMQLISENEVELPPPAHSNRLVQRNKYRALNKPPGLSLNGELYADELARMSNYEILDLRKRNSKSQIFAKSDRASSLTLEEVSKRKHQLDHQIEQELLKRNLSNLAQHQILSSDAGNVESMRLPESYGFGDTVMTPEIFIAKKSSDQMKFKDNKTKNHLSKEDIFPEIFKHYIDVSKKYSIGKRRKSNSISRRSLFNTQSLDQSDQVYRLTEKPGCAEITSSSSLKELSFRYLKSPPQNVLVTTPKIVSPPPETTTTCEIQSDPIKSSNDIVAVSTSTDALHNTYTDKDGNLTLPPLSPGFESDSAISAHYKTNQYTTNVTLEVRTTNESTKTNSDDHLFKKPITPAPKRKVKNVGKSLKYIQEEFTRTSKRSADNGADLAEAGSLRRSKRGQVPRRPEPIFAIFYQKELKRMEKYEKNKKYLIKNQREEVKTTNKKSLQCPNSKTSKRTENILSVVPENADVLSGCSGHGTKLVKRKESTRMKNKRTDNVTQSQEEHMSPASSVVHLNNIFDQLKENSLTSNATMQIRPQNKIKPLNVSVRRLNISEVTSTNGSCTSTYSNRNSNSELVSWLKNNSKVCNNNPQQTIKTSEVLQISSARNLQFIELQGLEYAFYDTVEKASVGYLRFKPRQIKSRKKARRFGLQFINLLGLFRIAVNNDESIISVGDMVIIEKSAYYDIQSLSDDIGILMVIKI